MGRALGRPSPHQPVVVGTHRGRVVGFDRALEKVESHRGRKEQVRIAAGPFNSCVALGMLLNLSEPHLSHLQNGNNSSNVFVKGLL